MKQPISIAQARAIYSFAQRAGHQWRSKLRNLWINDRIQRTPELKEEAALLQQVRNDLGPHWLDKIKLEDVKRWAFPPLEDKRTAKHGPTFATLHAPGFKSEHTSGGLVISSDSGSIVIRQGQLDDLVSLLALAKEHGHVR